MDRKNPHAHDEHWWIFIDHPVQLVIIVLLTSRLTLYALKHAYKLTFQTVLLLLSTYGTGYLIITFSDNAISIFALLWNVILALIVYMKIRYHEPRR